MDKPEGGGLALASLLVSLALWPIGLLGMMFFFFGDADRSKPDPRDAVAPYFFGPMLFAAALVFALAVPVWGKHPGKCTIAALSAAPWLFLSGLFVFRMVAG